jgi:rhodanese-related sulfurtransferase
MGYFIQFLLDNWFIVLPLLGSIFIFFKLENIRNSFLLEPQQMTFFLNRKNALLIDIRNEKDFLNGHISQAVCVGPDIELCKKEIKKNPERPVIIVCQNGNYSSRMANDLKKDGQEIFTLKGGINSWTNEKLPLIS